MLIVINTLNLITNYQIIKINTNYLIIKIIRKYTAILTPVMRKLAKNLHLVMSVTIASQQVVVSLQVSVSVADHGINKRECGLAPDCS